MLTGKVVLVTGAASGIGRAAAELFGRLGASVLAADCAPVVETVAAIEATGAPVVGCEVDVTDRRAVEVMVRLAVTELGGLHGAFNNAGVTLSRGDVHEADIDDWYRTIDVNLHGVFLCMREEIGAMLGYSQIHISRVLRRALSQMREQLSS